MKQKVLTKIIDFIREEMMSTGSTAGKPGFSGKADAEGQASRTYDLSRVRSLPFPVVRNFGSSGDHCERQTP